MNPPNHLLAAIASVAVAGAAGCAKPELGIVNALDVPLVVWVDGETVRVPAKGQHKLQVGRGEVTAVATLEDGTEVDRATLKATRSKSKLVFNPLGAALLSTRGVLYNFHGITMDKPRPTQFFYLQKVFERGEDVHFFLEGPSLQIEQPRGGKPGTVERIALEATLDWRVTVAGLQDTRREEAKRLAEEILALEPDEPDARAAVASFQPRPPPPPPPPAPVRTSRDWEVLSADGRARLSQSVSEDGACDLRCSVRGGSSWTRPTCIAHDFDHRFVSSDCERVVVLHRLIEGKAGWQQKPVVRTYVDGSAKETLAALRFVSKQSALIDAGDGWRWLLSDPRLAKDGSAIEFMTSDRQTHRLPLTGAASP